MSQGDRFRRKALKRGYKVDEVDDFLERAESTLAGRPIGEPTTAVDVRDVVFRTRFGGYDEWQVDLHLDRLEKELEELEAGLPPRGSNGFRALEAGPSAYRDEPSVRDEPSFRDGPSFRDEPRFREEPSFRDEPRFREEPSFRDEPRFREEPSFRDEPRFREEPSFRDEPRFREEPSFRDEPRFREEPSFRDEPRFRESASFRDDPRLRDGEPSFRDDPRFREGRPVRDEPRFREEPSVRDEPRFREEAPYRAESLPRDDRDYRREPDFRRDPDLPLDYRDAARRGEPGYDPDPALRGQPARDLTAPLPPISSREGRGAAPAAARAAGRGVTSESFHELLPPARSLEGDPYDGRHGKADMTVHLPSIGGGSVSPFTNDDKARLAELRATFTPRRFGSGYDPAQVDRVFDSILAMMDGRGGGRIAESDLQSSQFGLVQGGYFEDEVDTALREVRELFSRRMG